MEDALEKALRVEARKKIYENVNSSPGLHFRELQRRTDLAVGSLQYHLDYLVKVHLVKVQKEGKFIRYYSIRGKQLGEDTKAMSMLRQESIRKIILFLLEKKRANNLKISAAIGLSPSTTSGYLTKLTEGEFVEKKQSGRQSYFCLINPEQMKNILIEHRGSFLDSVVNSFVEIWEELGEAPKL